VAYFVKPVEFEPLLSKVEASIEYSRLNRAVRAMQKRLQQWRQDVNSVEKALVNMPRGESLPSLNTFFALTFQNITGALRDLDHIMNALGGTAQPPQEVCHLLNCPRLDTLVGALKDAIQVIGRTKAAFKSKELAELRKRLEKTARDMSR
jgi:hypothetical protein